MTLHARRGSAEKGAKQDDRERWSRKRSLSNQQHGVTLSDHAEKGTWSGDSPLLQKLVRGKAMYLSLRASSTK